MFHRTKRLNAFIVGCLASIVVFGYPSQLLAQSNTAGDPIQGITSTTQEAPTTAAQVNDVMTGLAAGASIGDLIEPKPEPLREYIAFSSSIWPELFGSDYDVNNSQITTGEWISEASGNVIVQNEDGISLPVEVTMSLEILPDHYSFISQDDISLLSSVSARFGIAWTTFTNVSDTSTHSLVFWVQTQSGSNPSTTVFPLARVSTEDIDLLTDTGILMEGLLDNPEYYNIENIDNLGLLSSFRSSVRSALVGVAKAVALAGVAAVVAVFLAPTALAAVAAVAALAVIALIEAADGVDKIGVAREELRDALSDEGWNADDATGTELLAAAKIEDLV